MPECLRCGECCKKLYYSSYFDENDQERVINGDGLWLFYHPFIYWILGYGEIVSPNDLGIFNKRWAWALIREKEKEFEKEMEYKINFPYGGELSGCPFLTHESDIWSCIIYDIRPDVCRKYYCEKTRKEKGG